MTIDKPGKTRQHFKSLRAFLNALRDLNDMREIRREVDTELEIGAIIRRTHEMYAPAPLFTNIRGHAGYQVVGAPLSYSSLPQARMALAQALRDHHHEGRILD